MEKIEVKLEDSTGAAFEFQDLHGLRDFLNAELEFWKKQSKIVDEKGSDSTSQNKHEFFTAANHLQQMVKTIDSWNQKDGERSRDELNQLTQNLTQQASKLKPRWLWRGNPACHELVELQAAYGTHGAQGFVAMALSGQLKADSHAAFVGTIAGYEFVFQDSDLTNRRMAEKDSFSRMRGELSQAKQDLIHEVETFKSEFKVWEQDTQEKANRLYDLNKRIGERRFRQHAKIFQEHLHSWGQSISDLEATYEEKLKLEKPAQYWSRAAKKYREQGRWWSLILLVVLCVGLLAVGKFFLAWLEGQEVGISLNTLQGVAIFGTFGAVFAFLVRVLSKLVFSSFHLMRDAEEREQLTYLYLALTKEAEINKESRDVVLQALFSRTESGLLGGDSSPTMPTTSEALRVLSRGRAQ